jgi:hypothetical protein
MHTPKLAAALLAALCCLLAASRAEAQHAYGYASMSYDSNTGTLTGYAATELDYETAYYYDAEVHAQIQDENGNVLASGSGTGNPIAHTFLEVFQAVLCIRLTLISYVYTLPRFLGCEGGRYDYWGFSDYWWGTYWDYGGFFGSRRTRCIFDRLILIASIVTDFLRCLPANFDCRVGSTRILPSGLRAGIETPYLRGMVPGQTYMDNTRVWCTVTDQFGRPMRGVTIRFGFDRNVIENDGGHQNHTGQRPTGTYSHTVVNTNPDGVAETTYTAPPFGGSTRITIQPPEGPERFADIYAQVPGLEALPPPVGNAGYILEGSDEEGNPYHPNGHYGTPEANAGLRQIAADYRDTFYPADQFPDGVPRANALRFNDQSLRLGGKFDITPNFRVLPAPSWQTGGSHREHRVGINADVETNGVTDDVVTIDGVRQRRWAVLENIFRERGSTRTGREFQFNHWHLRFEFGNQQGTRASGSVPADGEPTAVPGRIEAEKYDDTGDDEAYGSFVPDYGGSASDTLYNYPQVLPIAGNEGASYVPTAGGQWMNYTVNVASSGSYTFEARVASPGGGSTFHFEVDGVDVTGPIYIPNTGSGDAYQFVAVNDIRLEAGRRVVRLVIHGVGAGKGNFDYFTVSPYAPPQICSPEWWEMQNCRDSGGYWDYGLCACNYGGYYY